MSVAPPLADSQTQDSADSAQLATLGYKQQLTRALGLWSNFAVGFTYLSPAGSFTLGGWGWLVNVGGLIYGVAAILWLSYASGDGQEAFLDRWLVPLSVGGLFVVGVLYLLIFRPKENIQPDARAE